MNKDFASAISYILTSASNDELSSIYEAIVNRRQSLSRTARVKFMSGDKVKFSSRGVDYSGVIKDVKIKKASVKMTNGQTYLVPLNMLEAA